MSYKYSVVLAIKVMKAGQLKCISCEFLRRRHHKYAYFHGKYLATFSFVMISLLNTPKCAIPVACTLNSPHCFFVVYVMLVLMTLALWCLLRADEEQQIQGAAFQNLNEMTRSLVNDDGNNKFQVFVCLFSGEEQSMKSTKVH